MVASVLSIKIRVHVIDNGNNEIRGGGVKRDSCCMRNNQSSFPDLMLTLKWFMPVSWWYNHQKIVV